MSKKKYRIRKDLFIKLNCCTVYRIEALKDFGFVKKGDIGGFVESKSNLSQDGDCWIYDNAIAIGNSKILDNAEIHNEAFLCDEAIVCGNATVHDGAVIANNAVIRNHALVADDAVVDGHAVIMGFSYILNDTSFCDNAIIVNSEIADSCLVKGDAVIKNARIFGNCTIGHSARINNNNDFFAVTNFYGGQRKCTTFYRDEDDHIMIYSDEFGVSGEIDLIEKEWLKLPTLSRKKRYVLLLFKLARDKFGYDVQEEA